MTGLAAQGGDTAMLSAVVACEVAFWGFLVTGLLARYALRARRLGGALLLGVPLADAGLVAFCALHLASGGTAGATHGLAAVYLGVSVTFGPVFVARADVWFAHRFAGGPAPVRPPERGPERLRHEWQMWRRCAGASGIAVAFTLLMQLLSDGGARTAALWNTTAQTAAVTVIWLAAGPLRHRYAAGGRRTRDTSTA
ncbi:hypothetical protein SRB5_14070 [Streptomyces sp. RB5]|uniref:Uncharacterized protein n=1 Tax=Streptomyces smaragdinus TaxID=2585196 RepID=A0A7K0CDZ8_9ACTN|nr:hypothetical protein [Streptomyces smaragdinus]MQY11292.1 hypothetical protein [Streptomyces smaragdinus]